jgi:hypothetical protein
MNVEYSFNDKKKGIELHFSEEPSKEQAAHLKASGFEEAYKQPLKWYAKQHPAFITFAKNLKNTLLKGEPFSNVLIQPSFEPSPENIDHNKFSYVTISFKEGAETKTENYVLFDSYKVISQIVATRFGKKKYGSAFKEVDVTPRNYKVISRELLKQGKVIQGDTKNTDQPEPDKKSTNLTTEPLANKNGVYTKEFVGANYEEIIIPIPKVAKFESSVRIVKGTDGLYRYGISIDSKWEGIGGVSFAPSVNSQTFQDRKQTLKAALDYIAGNTLNNEKAYNAIEQFANEQGIELYKVEPTEQAETPKQDVLKGDGLEIIEKKQEISPLYHGTCLPFERFDKQFLGLKTGDIPSHLGYHFTPNKNLAASIFANDPHNDSYEHCRFIEVGIKVNKTLKTTESALVKGILHWGIMEGIITDRKDELWELLQLPYMADERKEQSLVSMLNSDEWLDNGNPVINYEALGIRYLNEILKEQGFDSIQYKNEIEWPEENRYDWIVFDESQIIYRKQEYVGKTEHPDRSEKIEKPLGEQLADLGFEGLFSVQEAFSKPLKVADLQARWHDTQEHFQKQVKDPEVEQIKRWQAVLKALKGQKDKKSIEQRKELDRKIDTRLDELTHIQELLENEHIQFHQELVKHIIEDAKKLGHSFTNETEQSEFSSIVADGLFDERMIEPYYKQPIPEIANQIIQDFFKSTTPENPTKSETNGVEKNIADHPILDTDDAWTMTPLEYQQLKAIEKTGSSMILDAKDRRNHEAIIKQAIEDGKNIPQRVLDHYPWLTEGIPKKPEPKQAVNPVKTDKLKSFAQFLSLYKTIDGHMNDGALKETFGRTGKAALKELAQYLGLNEYKVDFNKAGVAVSGDLTLMGMFEPEKGIYISFNKDGFSNGVLYRTISHMKDYTGGGNNYFSETEFATPETIKEKVYRLVGIKEQASAPKTPSSSSPAKAKNDYIDRVVAHMHDRYASGERPTKKQIEQLKEQLDVPNLGMMWEAVELSWLLWYKQIYREPIPFEQRLHKMVHFWHEQQPTYAYSDSSKELYKQYSTPCPIGAMVAQYTGMDTAKSIFEPSAGNGLLLVGADPNKTHVNEIDPTRLASLKFQNFKKITSDNAIQPFPENMTKAYDVVVTNPPFAQWEEAKFDKELIIRKYFNNHVGLAGNIRLEHLMAGLALHTMKDTGKAAIIIMGHVYFGKDGFIAKYRPFFNWLFRHYKVDDVINMNSFKLYNKQGAIERTMLILIGGRNPIPKGVAPQQHQAPYLYDMVNDFPELWYRIKSHIGYNINTIINQLQIELQV